MCNLKALDTMDNLPAECITKLRESISGEVKTDKVTRVLFSTDASIHKIEPLGVVFPRNIEELGIIVATAYQYRVPLIARGSGSGLAGQAIGRGLIIDCSRYLNRLVEINPEERTAIVEPGLILDDLNHGAMKFGLQYGPDPASSERATIGGCIGNNATGAHSIIYGMTADHIISADVVLSDGSVTTLQAISEDELNYISRNNNSPTISQVEKDIYRAAQRIRSEFSDEIRKSWPASWRRVSGYNLNYLIPWSPSYPKQWDLSELPYPPVQPNTINLAQLLVGSEGTLGILRRARLRLVPILRHTLLCVINFTSIYDACVAVPSLLELNPSAIELIPQSLIDLARSVPSYAHQLSFVTGNPDAMLVVEFSGNSLGEIKTKVEKLKGMRRWEIDPLVAETSAQQKQVWAVRKVGLGILMSRLGDNKPTTFIEDMSVPVERLGEFVQELDLILQAHKTYADYYGHASVGCLHIRPLLNIKTPIGRADLRSIAEAAVKLVLSMGGVVAAEHGDGITRGEWIERAYGLKLVQAMKLLKQAADPRGIFNPGKIINPPRMDTSLRYDDQYQPHGWMPTMTFSSKKADPQRLVEAIEQCNGAGVCRKTTGVMCPSFQATQNELYSTRGRANLLRAMISNEFNDDKVAVQAVKDTLDKCLACKGCKADCPSAVDIAKLKYEFYQHYYSLAGHHHPLRDYLFGYITQVACFGNIIPSIANFIITSNSLRSFRNKTLGLSEKRILPRLSGTSLHKQWHSEVGKKLQPDCLFLSDAFNEYFYPHVGLDALRILKVLGYKEKMLSTLGTGRSLISKGFLDQAKRHAKKLVNEIMINDPEGVIPVVGLEPSEIYTFLDEYPDLFPGNDYVEKLADRVYMIDEFLLRPDLDGLPRMSKLGHFAVNQPDRTKVLLHGHCYQKAHPPAKDGYPTGVNATKIMLQQAGYSVEIIDDGCCGMAGAFGYENEHCDLSMQVGELSLFPAIRRSSQATITAAGVSCKSQIEDGTGCTVFHPISLLARRYLDN